MPSSIRDEKLPFSVSGFVPARGGPSAARAGRHPSARRTNIQRGHIARILLVAPGPASVCCGTRPAALLLLLFLLHDTKVELSPLQVDAHHADVDAVAEPVAVLAAPTDETVRRLFVVVIIV